MTFSAPKSVSVLFGIGDPATQSAIHDAHARAVREAFAYFERSTAFARRGAGRRRDRPWRRAGGCRVRASDEPQRRSAAAHPRARREPRAGRGRTLVSARRPARLRARPHGRLPLPGGAASELTRTLGVEWTPVNKGSAEIRGVSSRVIRAFSRRRAEIEAAMELHGSRGRHAAQVAALDTRRAKDRAVRPEAARPGVAPARRQARTRRGADRPTVRPGDARADRLGRGVRRAGGADRSDAEPIDLRPPRGPPGALPARGPGRDGAGARARRRRVPGSPAVVPLANGQRVERRYSTIELVETEQRTVSTAVALRGSGRGVATADAVEAALASRPHLSGEQRAMVERLTRDGDGVAVIVGPAGTGKTTAIGAAREAWEATGIPVRGCAIARKAAHQLGRTAGMRGHQRRGVAPTAHARSSPAPSW